MKTTNKILIIIFLSLSQICFSQKVTDDRNASALEPFLFILKEDNFLDIKRKGLKFYKEKIALYGIEKVSGEGSPYTDFLKFISDWELKLANHDYSLKSYLSSLSKKSDFKEIPVKGCTWKEFGPIVKSSGSETNPHTGTRPKINGIGHTEFIRIDNNNPDNMLVGSISGGLFFSSSGGESNNGGSAWTALSDLWETSACSWAEFSDDYPGTIVAVSTLGGRVIGSEKSNQIGPDGGILISKDYGQTWKKIISTKIFNSWDRIHKIVFNPDNPKEIFIAKTGGLFKYTDINVSDDPNKYEQIFDPTIPNVFVDVEGVDIEIVKSDILFPNGNFFAVSFRGIDSAQITNIDDGVRFRTYVTKNAWQTHQEVFTSINKLQATFEFSPSNLEDLDADPINISKAGIHCHIKQGNYLEVWKLKFLNLSEELIKSEPGANFGLGFAFAVNPFDEDKIIYSRMTGLNGTNDGFLNQVPKPQNTGLHDDKEHFIWHPKNPNEVWVAHHGGVSKSTDNGVSWESMDRGLGVGMILTFDHSENDINKLMLSLDHDGNTRLGNTYAQSNLAHDWNVFTFGDGMASTIIDQGEYQFYFANTQTGDSSEISLSYDAISTNLSQFITSYFPIDVGVFNAWYEPAQNGKVVYSIGVENDVEFGHVYKTNLLPGSMPTRYRISDFTSFLPSGNIFLLTQINASEKNDNVLFANGYEVMGNGQYNQVLFYSDQANASNPQTTINSWKKIQMPYDNGFNPVGFGTVKESHYIDGRYYFTTAGNTANNEYRVVKLDIDSQGNQTITDITGNLPNCDKNMNNDYSIVVEKGTHEGIYIMQGCGVFYLHGTDLEAENYSWTQVGSELPNITKTGIKAFYALNKLRVGTYGRGLWEGCFICPEDEIYYESGFYNDSYIFKEALKQIHSTAQVQNEQNVKYRAGEFIDLNPGFQAEHGSIFDAFIHPCEPDKQNSFKENKANPWKYLRKTSKEATKIIDQQHQKGILIYPNPINDIATLHIEEFNPLMNYKLIIYSFKGVKMKEIDNVSEHTKLDVSFLSSGIYIINVSDGIETRTVRFIKN